MPNQKTIDHYRLLALQNLQAQLPGVILCIVTVNEDAERPHLEVHKFSANLQNKSALAELFLEIGNGLKDLKDEEVIDLTDCEGGIQ